MAVPKQKQSRSRTRRRKAQWMRVKKPTFARCGRCRSPKRPHTVCSVCGTYDGRTVLDVEEF